MELTVFSMDEKSQQKPCPQETELASSKLSKTTSSPSSDESSALSTAGIKVLLMI